MKTKIIYQNILPPRGFVAIMLFGYIFARKKFKPLSERVINHENIHAAQAKECGGWALFYVQYLYQWVRVGFKYGKISFEREASDYDADLEYLENRTPFRWLIY